MRRHRLGKYLLTAGMTLFLLLSPAGRLSVRGNEEMPLTEGFYVTDLKDPLLAITPAELLHSTQKTFVRQDKTSTSSAPTTDEMPPTTEPDLRELMGLVRMDSDEYRAAAMEVLAQEKSREGFLALAEKADEEQKERALALDRKKQEARGAYEELEGLFTSGADAGKVLDALEEYKRQSAAAEAAQEEFLSFRAPVPMDDMEDAVRQAGIIMDLCTTDIDIGDAGAAADTFLLKDLSLSGVTPGSITCRTAEGDGVYSQFHGVVQAVKEDMVRIKSGETILITYQGVVPEKGLSAGTKVLQYERIGSCGGSRITVSMSLCGEEENILKAYGTHGLRWYEAYLLSLPWEEGCIDFSRVRSFLPASAAQEGSSYMVTGDGDEVQEPPPVRGGEDLVLDKNPFAGGFE